MIALINMQVGNVGSVERALAAVGGSCIVTDRAPDIERAEAIILPGVGAFADGMASLHEKALVEPLRRAARDGKPILGICLGMQLLADESEEYGRHVGLGLIPGRVVRLVADRPGYRIPNVGWCDVQVVRPGPVIPAALDGASFYFVHGYHFQCAEPGHVAMTTEFSGRPVTAAVRHGNLTGVQFHPEKSQDNGLDLLAAFVARGETGALADDSTTV